MKIAPMLQALLHEPVKGVPMLAAYHGQSAVKELRALLAVAIAAQTVARRYQTNLARHQNRRDDILVRALARLEKVSAP